MTAVVLEGGRRAWRPALLFSFALAMAVALVAGCATEVGPGTEPGTALSSKPPPIDLAVSASRATTPEAVERLAGRRVIFMGEVHDRAQHHAGQIAAIRALHKHGLNMALGLEQFQRQAQPDLDAFVAGRIGESELLRRSEFERRWGFEYELYREILSYARSERIPLVALGAPSEAVSALSRGGIEALPAEYRALLPNPPRLAEGQYRERLARSFSVHGAAADAASDEAKFQRFLEVQMLWDETMAQTAADYLAAHPDKTLVVLAGIVHVAYMDAIPGRLWRRLPTAQAWVFPDRDPHKGGVHNSGSVGPMPHAVPTR